MARSSSGARLGSRRCDVPQPVAQPVAQELVVLRLANALRAELRPALEIVAEFALCAAGRTTGS